VFLIGHRPTFQRCMLPPSSSVDIQLRTWQYIPEDLNFILAAVRTCMFNKHISVLSHNKYWLPYEFSVSHALPPCHSKQPKYFHKPFCFQEAIQSENPPIDPENEELESRGGHRLTWRRYHRYKGQCCSHDTDTTGCDCALSHSVRSLLLYTFTLSKDSLSAAYI
jgi:hypothetical protein